MGIETIKKRIRGQIVDVEGKPRTECIYHGKSEGCCYGAFNGTCRGSGCGDYTTEEDDRE